jgi:hypothetical protein
MLFLGGVVFGASAVVFLLASGALDDNTESRSLSDNRGSRSGGQYDSPIPDTQLSGLADVAADLSITAASLQRSAEKFASLSPVSTANDNLNYEAAGGTRSSSLAEQMPMLPSEISIPAPGAANVVQQAQELAPPTPEQVEHYYSLQSRLYDAAYDHSAVLAELTQQSNQLTPAQRQELTNEAIEMIKRGELKAEQFMLSQDLEAE